MNVNSLTYSLGWGPGRSWLHTTLEDPWLHSMILEVYWDGLWTLSFGLSQFHGHGSWLVCEVALVIVTLTISIRATSHTSQEPWLWEPKRKCPNAAPMDLQNHVVWSHMWPDPQLNAISMNFYSCGLSHIINHPLMWNPCRLYIHLAFTYSIGPSSIVWSELGLAPPFPPMRVLEVYRSRALNLMYEVALSACYYWGSRNFYDDLMRM